MYQCMLDVVCAIGWCIIAINICIVHVYHYNQLTYTGTPTHSYDCDAFTREFYRLNFGLEDFTPVQVQQPPPRPVKQVRDKRM